MFQLIGLWAPTRPLCSMPACAGQAGPRFLFWMCWSNRLTLWTKKVLNSADVDFSVERGPWYKSDSGATVQKCLFQMKCHLIIKLLRPISYMYSIYMCVCVWTSVRPRPMYSKFGLGHGRSSVSKSLAMSPVGLNIDSRCHHVLVRQHIRCMNILRERAISC